VLAADIIAHRSQLDMRIEIPKFIRDIVSRQSIQEARKVFDLYTGFANSIPTWYNKGSAPAKLHAPDSSKPADSEPRKNNVIPFPTVRKKKVSRNDLCPCGSGKKYKDCCGKSNQDE
jgi:preprotein translocase subunit SecA